MRAALVVHRLAVATLLLGAACVAHAAPDLDRQGKAAADGSVEVFCVSGDVEISTWDLPEYRLEAKSDDGVERIDVTEGQGALVVRVVTKKGALRSRDARLQLRIPAGSRLGVVTSDARIAVYGLAGAANLQSASGLIEVVAARGPAELRSVSGAIRYTGTGVPTTLNVESLSGRIEVRNAAGTLDALATMGAVDVAMELADRVHVQALSGRAQVEARLSPQADVRVESFGGEVQARLVAEAGYRYEVGTNSGAFLTCFGRSDRGTSGQVGAGVASVRLRSFGGQVRLCDT